MHGMETVQRKTPTVNDEGLVFSDNTELNVWLKVTAVTNILTSELEDDTAYQRKQEGNRPNQRFHHSPGFQRGFFIHFKEAANQPETGVVDVGEHGCPPRQWR